MEKASDRILLAHGGGGEMTSRLLATHVLPQLTNPALAPLTDSAIFMAGRCRLAMTTDSYVIQPLEFPGGDIGKLSVCGTLNDLAMVGAQGVALSLALILEEGLSTELLDRVIGSIKLASSAAGVPVVTGDTKVVGKGQADGMFINTTGLGQPLPGIRLRADRVRPGDRILISGRIAEHGLAIMSQRRGLRFDSPLVSDVAALAPLVLPMLEQLGGAVRWMRDPTRGGVANCLVELAEAAYAAIELDEPAVPISLTTRHAAEMLGIDPLSVANEGKFLAVVANDQAEAAVAFCRAHALGRHAAIIGTVTDGEPGLVELLTHAGGRRIVQRPYGEELPRIC
ncbi:MAG: hydrogenase expression/formation protein HypE [Phycisphaerae bacterium]|nr:hydrogenase expression/formation protein HypE [Phycisphaerae bacterium]